MGLGNFVEAAETAMMGVMLPILKAEFHLTNLELAALGSSAAVGMIIGAVVLGRLSDRVGRQPIFQLSLLISSLFAFASAGAPTFALFVLLRTIMAVGYAGNIVTDVTILAEFLPVANRGYYLASMDVWFGVGALMSVSLSWLLIPIIGWRWMVFVSAFPAFLLYFFRRSIPESPRFLFQAGRPDEAVAVLQLIARTNRMPESTVEALGRLDIRTEVQPDEDEAQNYAKLFDPVLRGTTVSLMLVWFLNAMAGTVFMWLPLYMAEGTAGGKDASMSDSYLAAVLMAAGDLIGSVFLMSLVRYADRRTLIRGSLLMNAGAVLSLGFVHNTNTILILLPFLVMIKTMPTTMLYVVTPEVYPTDIRTTGLGLCSAAHRLAPAVGHLVVATSYDASFATLVFVFSSVYFAAFLVSLTLISDTRNKPLAKDFYERAHTYAKEHHA